MNDTYLWCAVGVIAVVTAIIRFLPFVVFNGNKKTPKIVERLGKALPCAVMGMLVVYCLKGIGFNELKSFVPELLSCGVVFVAHILKRNTLISIVLGTICYMVLVQMVF